MTIRKLAYNTNYTLCYRCVKIEKTPEVIKYKLLLSTIMCIEKLAGDILLRIKLD